MGPKCDKICDRYNPCSPQGSTSCTQAPTSPSHSSSQTTPTQTTLTQHSEFYQCKCAEGYRGRYCEEPITETCPASWWATPICGPCNCPKDKGFNPICNKTTGECS